MCPSFGVRSSRALIAEPPVRRASGTGRHRRRKIRFQDLSGEFDVRDFVRPPFDPSWDLPR
eukprot:289255-Alexandrium_andersonii.AAC.1